MKTHIAPTIPSRRMIAFLTLLACWLCLNFQPALATPGSWTRKADMPMAFGAHAACEVDGILYVIGGGGVTDPGYRRRGSLRS